MLFKRRANAARRGHLAARVGHNDANRPIGGAQMRGLGQRHLQRYVARRVWTGHAGFEIKRPAAGDYRVQGEFGGSAEPIQPDADTLAAADRALAAVAALGHGEHAYVRVDGVISAGRFLIMELELIEPFLHLAGRPAAAERLAEDVAARIARVRPSAPASTS